MQVERLPTVDEIAAWMRIGPQAIAAAEKMAADAYDLRQAVAGIYTSAPLGIYLDGGQAYTVNESSRATDQDCALVVSAIEKAGWPVEELRPECWPFGEMNVYPVKVAVAHSPFLRGVGETLNFFPHYASPTSNEITNSPGPVQSMLTSGLLGAGLGYGAGWLGERMMADNWKKGRLSKTLGLLGAGVGMLPGALWAGTNMAQGRAPWDPYLLHHRAGAPVDITAPGHEEDWAKLEPKPQEISGTPGEIKMPAIGPKTAIAIDKVAQMYGDGLRAFFKEALEMDAFGEQRDPPPRGPLSVNVDAMGRVLWDTATPQTAGTTMAVLQAAQQMPGGEEPGFVTPMQVANLSAHMGMGYGSGWLVGQALGLLTGMPPETQKLLANVGMWAGVARAVLPGILGR